MSLSDPFNTTYEGARNNGKYAADLMTTLGTEAYAQKQKQDKINKSTKMLKDFGIIQETDIPPSDDELKSGLTEAAKKMGVNQLSFMESDDPAETRKSIETAYKVYGLPMPKGKKDVKFDAKRAAELGMDYDTSSGDLKFNPSKSLLANLGILANEQKMTSEGMRKVGYDQKGIPMWREDKPNIPEEKFNLEKEEKARVQQAKSQAVLDSADKTLSTISEIEKGMDYFGTLGNVPSFPGTKKVNWEANIDKLKSEQVLNTIKEMKDASKTGATGFGALSEKELTVLENAQTALRKDLPREDAQRYLDQVKVIFNKIKDNKSNGASSGSNDDPLGLR